MIINQDLHIFILWRDIMGAMVYFIIVTLVIAASIAILLARVVQKSAQSKEGLGLAFVMFFPTVGMGAGAWMSFWSLVAVKQDFPSLARWLGF